jgi:uncharacterized cupredoxin-like copper-binding protein
MYARRSLGIASLPIAALLALSCGGTGASPSPAHSAAPTATVGPSATGAASASAGSGTTVAVTVQEFSVLPAVASVPTGDVTFSVTNSGPDDVHEFVIIRTDLAPAALPTLETHAVDEEADGLEVIDEIEDIAVGTTQQVTATLEPGAYVLICNIYDEGEHEAHYQMGMYTSFTVTQ